MVYGALGILHLILWVVAVVEILKSNKDMINKLLWILIVLLLPVIGLILYFLMGRS